MTYKTSNVAKCDFKTIQIFGWKEQEALPELSWIQRMACRILNIKPEGKYWYTIDIRIDFAGLSLDDVCISLISPNAYWIVSSVNTTYVTMITSSAIDRLPMVPMTFTKIANALRV